MTHCLLLAYVPVGDHHLFICCSEGKDAVFLRLGPLDSLSIILVVFIRLLIGTLPRPEAIVHTVLDEAHRAYSIDHIGSSMLVSNEPVLVDEFIGRDQVV